MPKNNKSNLTQFLCRATKMQPNSSLSRKYCRLTCGPTRILSNRKKFSRRTSFASFVVRHCTPASARCGCSAFLQAAKTRRRRGELHCTVRDCFLFLTGAAERERSFFYKARSISTQSIFHAQINTANSCQKQCLKKKKAIQTIAAAKRKSD